MSTVTSGKMVYRLAEGSAQMVDLLGSKGAHACEMVRIGISVPPGFVITTEACREFYRLERNMPDGLWASIVDNMHLLEKQTGKRFGDPTNPLIVSVRSGSSVSMPGMMDTILNMGVTDDTLGGLAAMMNDERPALDAHRRLIQGFGNVVLGIDKDRFDVLLVELKRKEGVEFDHELDPRALRELIDGFKHIVVETIGHSLPGDPWELLRHAIEAVFVSWNNPRAITYRDHEGISHDLGTGCVIMAMVFGNLGADSGTGVLFSRSPASGENTLYGEFLPNAQGEDVVAGVRTPLRIASLKAEMPDVYRQVQETARRLEAHYRDVQDIEFTVEKGKLFMLQTRSAKRTPMAALKIAVDFVSEGVLDRAEAIGRISPEDLTSILMPRFETAAKQAFVEKGSLLAQGVGGSPGAASGVVVMDPDRAVELAETGTKVILVRPETSPDDVHGIIKAQGVLTSHGGMTSHAAVVTRGLGKACVVGCGELHFNMTNRTATSRGMTITEGDLISIDGATGEVFLGEVPSEVPHPDELSELKDLLRWADQVRTLQVWANADTVEDAVRARENGAEGIGLCRTEHMFFGEDRLPHIQRLLTVGGEASRLLREVETLGQRLAQAPALDQEQLRLRLAQVETNLRESESVKGFYEELGNLERFQSEDFYGILKAMESLPVVVRLLDAPLHEFLPNHEALLLEVEHLKSLGDTNGAYEKERMLDLVDALRESNPMMGHRGCRVGLTMPEIYEMQVRAIVSAACRLIKEGFDVRPEVMIPIVSHANELKWLYPRLEKVASETRLALGIDASYKFGTMIEVPRAALTASEIAGQVQFFSFGSNDLTQMTFAYSRDDAESKFIRHYVESEILPANPFETLDMDGVGRLMRLAVEEGRAVNPELEIGICGEHGGDPKSVAFCHKLGLNYVSASPFRVPVARLAAAQSALGQLKLF
jgi:pyruvate,orthophosphate dikinase